jgi:hypothetical protein
MKTLTDTICPLVEQPIEHLEVKPSETPFQDTLKNIQKKPTGVQYKNSLERAEEERKERLNKPGE